MVWGCGLAWGWGVSRAVARAERVPLDAYYTPDDVAARCVAVLPSWPRRIVEPSAGGGAFVRGIRARWRTAQITGCDVNPDALGLRECNAAAVCDFVDFRPGDIDPDAVVGNPPYSDAEAHIRHALRVVRPDGVVAFLLRLAMLESQKRAAFWTAHPPRKVWVLSARPSFTGGGTDSAAYGWFVWERGFAGPPALGWLP